MNPKDYHNSSVDEAGLHALLNEFVECVKHLDSDKTVTRLFCLFNTYINGRSEHTLSVLAKFNALKDHKTSAD